MNSENSQLLATVERLEATLTTPTDEQRELLRDVHRQIERNGRFYNISSAALTIDLMREHDYDVNEADGGIIDTIAEKVEVDADMLWDGVAVWAEHYGLKRLEDF